jgi:uncharacterized OsmC-like protein
LRAFHQAGENCPAAVLMRHKHEVRWEIHNELSNTPDAPDCGMSVPTIKAAQQIFSGSGGLHRRSVQAVWKQFGPTPLQVYFPDVLSGPNTVRIALGPPAGGSGASFDPVQTCLSGIISGATFFVAFELAQLGFACSSVDGQIDVDVSQRQFFGVDNDPTFRGFTIRLTVHSQKQIPADVLSKVLLAVQQNNPTTWALQDELQLGHRLYQELH